MYGFNALDSTIAAYAAQNLRRYTYYAAPSGAATLVGLLSVLNDPQDTDGPEFGWHERRMRERRAVTTDFTDGSAGPWQDNAGSGGATIAFTAGYIGARLNVTTNETLLNWQVGERIRIHRQRYGSTSYADVFAEITAITRTTDTTGVFTLTIQDAITVNNTANTDEGMVIQSLGTPFAEGSRSPGSRRPLFPIQPGNYTEIFKTPFAFSATEMRQAMLYDKNGTYPTTARDSAMDHLSCMENAVFFGQRKKTVTEESDGTPSVSREMGGIKWFLQQYESAGGGTFGYRPGGAALTSNDEDGKRIIQGPTTGILPYATWRLLEERIFRTTMTSSMEKLVLGGAKFCAAILNYYRSVGSNIRITRPYEEPTKLKLALTEITTDYGTLLVKSHPRFTDQDALSSSGFILDLPNLKLRPLQGRDMHLMENIQERDRDGRKDQYLTEASLELNFPDSHMYFESTSSIAIS